MAISGSLRALTLIGAVTFGVWARHPSPGAVEIVTGLIGTGLVVTGLFVVPDRGNRRLLVAAGFAVLGIGLDTQPGPVLPAIGTFCTAIAPLAFVVIYFRHPDPRLMDAPERRYVGWLTAWVVVFNTAVILFYSPLPLSPPAPLIPVDEVVRAIAYYGRWVGMLAGGLALAALSVRRHRRMAGLQRHELKAISITAGILGLEVALLSAVGLVSYDRHFPQAALWSLAVLPLTVPVGFGIAALVRLAGRLAVVDFTGDGLPPSRSAVRDFLRAVLRDPRLDLFVWDGSRYVDVADTIVWDAPVTRPRRLLETSTGEPLGAVLLEPHLSRRLDVVDAAMSAAALTLENLHLHAALEARLHEVRESRARIVAAAMAERRRVERDLHDGAQQRLFALATSLGRALAAGADPATRELLEEARHLLRRTLAELRDLARGIHPAVLEQIGLAGAVQSVAEPLAIDVTIEVQAGRLPPDVEATAYFVIREALINAAEHSGARSVAVTAVREDDELIVTVRDAGVGGARLDPAGGLQAMEDRVVAIGGLLSIESAEGGGTCVEARLSARDSPLSPG